MSIRSSALLLVATLTLGVVPAATANAPAPEEPFRSFTFSADCTKMPGRLHVEETSTGPEQFTITMRGSGLATGLDRDWFNWVDDDGYPDSKIFRHDRSTHRFSRSMTIPEPLDGRRVSGAVSDHRTDTSCYLDGQVRDTLIGVGLNTVSLGVSSGGGRLTVHVSNIRCRRSEVPRGQAVIKRADETIRIPLRSHRPCEGGWVEFIKHIAGTEMPRAANAVVHVGGRAWHVEYALHE